MIGSNETNKITNMQKVRRVFKVSQSVQNEYSSAFTPFLSFGVHPSIFLCVEVCILEV